MLFSYGYGWQWNWHLQKMQANRQWFWSLCRRRDTARCASPNGAHPWLYSKPLDAAIGQVPMPHCPNGRHGRQFWMKPKNTNKTQLLPSFLMVDQHKKDKQLWDPKQNPLLTSSMQHGVYKCETLLFKVKSSATFWAIKRINGQKFEKLLTLNKAQENLCAKYGPIAVKLLKCTGCWICLQRLLSQHCKVA